MKNKILMSGKGVPVSLVLSEESSVKRLEEYRKYFDSDAYLVDTDQEVNERPVYAPAEEVEDIGCSSGACTL